MSSRTVVLIAASVMLGAALTATVSTEVFAGMAAGTTRHHHHYHRSGAQVRHPYIPAMAPVVAGSPYCWPYDYSFDPYDYCGASYIVAW